MSHHNNPENASGQSFLLAHKERGETLAVFLERIRAFHAIPKDVSMTYAGRLDPMAEGLMIVLTGESCKEKDHYLKKDKTYRFVILFGVATDTYDVLGMPIKHDFSRDVTVQEITRCIPTFVKQTQFVYPPYSSVPVGGVPLFMHARAGTLPEVLPIKEGRIYSLQCSDVKTMPLANVIDSICIDIQKVAGDFRQQEIIAAWKKIAAQYPQAYVSFATCDAHVSSGVYIRSIASMIGDMVNVPALAYSIERLAIEDVEYPQNKNSML